MKLLRTGAGLAAALCVFSMGAAALVPVSDGFLLEKNERVPIPSPYELTRVVSVFPGYEPGALKNAQDLFFDRKGFYYIADTDNHAVLKLDSSFRFAARYTKAGGLAFSSPTGVSTDAEGDIYIADSGNARVVHLDPGGTYIESFTKPESELLYDVEFFSPAKVELNPVNNYLYVIQGKQFMAIDARGGFKGYLGDNKLGFDLWDYLFRAFASEKQKMQVSKRAPDPYLNFSFGPDGKLYAVGLKDTQRISIINTVGKNIYPEGEYGEVRYKTSGARITPSFSDIAVNGDGIITVGDGNTGCIYQYSQDGDLLAAFGGKGDTAGRFGFVSSLVFNGEGQLVTLDSSLGRIQVFEPTDFLKKVHAATRLYTDGEYAASSALWDEIRRRDRGYLPARRMAGMMHFKNEDYRAAAGEFYQAEDKEEYGRAFERLRYEFFRDHFAPVTAAAALLLLGFLFGARRLRGLFASLRKDLWKE